MASHAPTPPPHAHAIANRMAVTGNEEEYTAGQFQWKVPTTPPIRKAAGTTIAPSTGTRSTQPARSFRARPSNGDTRPAPLGATSQQSSTTRSSGDERVGTGAAA